MATVTVKSREWQKLSETPVAAVRGNFLVEIDIDSNNFGWARIVHPEVKEAEVEVEFIN